MTSSTVLMKILPSPIRPVRAAFMIASTARSATLSSQTSSIFTFGQKIDDIFGAAIEFGMALLAAEALGLDNGDALQPNFVQRLFHLVELKRFDHGLDFLHRILVAGPVRPDPLPMQAGGQRPGLAPLMARQTRTPANALQSGGSCARMDFRCRARDRPGFRRSAHGPARFAGRRGGAHPNA